LAIEPPPLSRRRSTSCCAKASASWSPLSTKPSASLTQKQLGERFEVKEQQIQRWEANLYSGVGVERLQEVADALGMEVKETVNYAATALPG